MINKRKVSFVFLLITMCMLGASHVIAYGKLKSPEHPVVKCVNGHTLKLTWEKVNEATGYKIYRSRKENGKYKLIKTTKKNKKYFIDRTVKLHKVYYYKICAYKKNKNKTLKSAKTSSIYARTYGNKGELLNAASIEMSLNNGENISSTNEMSICSFAKMEYRVDEDVAATKKINTSLLSDQVVWSSSDKTIASINANGEITTYEKEGECVIIAKLHNGILGKFKLKVVNYGIVNSFPYYNGNNPSVNEFIMNYADAVSEITTFFTIYGKEGIKGNISSNDLGEIIYSNSNDYDFSKIDSSVKKLMNNCSYPLEIYYIGKGCVEFRIISESAYYEICYSESADFETNPQKLAPHWLGTLHLVKPCVGEVTTRT